MDCIFCSIANGNIPSNTIFENDNFRVIMDISPANIGHCLVIPKKHCENIFGIDGDMLAEGMKIAAKSAAAQKKALNADGVNIIQNNGEAAGQTVNHFHIHVIPRFGGDNVIINFNPQKHTDGEFAEVREKLISAFQQIC